MALLFGDGFDHYLTTVSHLLQYWSGAGTSGYTLVTGRVSGRALQYTNPSIISVTFANSATVIVGLAFRLDTGGSDSFPPIIIDLADSGTTQLQVCVDAARHIQVKRGAGGTVLATSTNTLLVGVWYHVEFKCTINNSTGVIEVRVNGSSVGWIPQTTGLDTQQTGNAFVNGFRTAGNIAGLSGTYDDLYILDTTGSAPLNDFFGDNRIETFFAVSNGDTIQWTPTAGQNFECIDNNPPNDSVFVSASLSTQRDLYNFAELSSGSVLAAMLLTRAAKSDAGAASIKWVCKSGATTDVSAAQALGTSFLWYPKIYPVDPNTGAQWTLSNLNAAQFGQEVA